MFSSQYIFRKNIKFLSKICKAYLVYNKKKKKIKIFDSYSVMLFANKIITNFHRFLEEWFFLKNKIK